jgi:hypothetical protein
VAFDVGSLFHDGDIGEILGDPVEQIAPDFRVCDLTPPETHSHLYLRTDGKKAADVTHLKRDVVFTGFRPQTYFLDFGGLLRPARFPLTLALLVQELPILKHAANGRVSIRCDFHQIEASFGGDTQGLMNSHDAQLRTFFIYNTDFRSFDTLVYTLSFTADVCTSFAGVASPNYLARSENIVGCESLILGYSQKS